MNRKSIGIFGLLIALCMFMSIMTSNSLSEIFSGTFLQPNNIENLLRRTSMYGLLGIGVAFVIITSGIDLSIGSIVCLSGCLLALFLQVDYREVDSCPVIQIRAQEKTLLIAKDALELKPGDRIRLFGARRARNALLTVSKLEMVALENNTGTKRSDATLVTVEGDISRDDESGLIAKVVTVAAYSVDPSTQVTTLTLAGTSSRLKARDQLTLVHPQAGQKQVEVASATSRDGNTEIQLRRELGSDFNDQWLAIPQMRHQRMPIPVALLAVLGIAAGLGLLHGVLITKVGLQPFVVTLCGLLIYRGLSRWLVNDQPVGFGNEYAQSLSPMGSGKLAIFQWTNGGAQETFGIPYPLFIMLAVAVVAAVFLNLTVWGRYLLALGRNEEAARYSGINTARVTMIAYVICTVSAALGGMLFALDSNSVSPSSFGNFFELYAIAAAVLGGCSLRGGEGTVVGSSLEPP